MKIKYLGTAAAEGVPSLFCKCDTCQKTWIKGGKNIRSRSQSIINDDLLIDFPADTFAHMNQFQVHLENIHNCIITHSHSDHFYVTDFMFRRKGFAAVVEDEKFHVYGTTPVYNAMLEGIEKYKSSEVVDAFLITPYIPFNIKDYTIIPVTANHDQKAGTVNYIINQGNKNVFYCHDTGWFTPETWEYLAKWDQHIDLLSLDCTAGIQTGWRNGHLSFDVFLEVVEKLKEMKLVDNNTIIVANHFSHNGHATYDEMKEVCDKYGILVSYDGMEVQF